MPRKRAAGASEVEDEGWHDARRRKRAQGPATSELSNRSGGPSGPDSEATINSNRETRHRRWSARRADDSRLVGQVDYLTTGLEVVVLVVKQPTG